MKSLCSISYAPYWLCVLLTLTITMAAPAQAQGAYPMLTTAFELPTVQSDPFDYEQTAVTVRLRQPDGKTVDVPAFYDGGASWRMRYTPTLPGKYAVVAVQFNGRAALMAETRTMQREWTVAGPPQPGFIRIRQDPNHFVFDNGTRYFPLGHNQAWQNGGAPDIPTLFAKMGAAGENWSRVWMNHWDGKNLDWPYGGHPPKLGTLNLEAAREMGCDCRSRRTQWHLFSDDAPTSWAIFEWH